MMRKLLAVLLLLTFAADASAFNGRRPVRNLISAIAARRQPPQTPPVVASSLHVFPNGYSSVAVGGNLYDITVSYQAIYPGSIVLEGPATGNAFIFGQSGTVLFQNYPPGNYKAKGLCGAHGDFSPELSFTVP